jgi:hypothetical protein
MSEQATLTIPKPLYDQARRLAENQERDVNDLVAEVLAQSLPLAEPVTVSADKKREIQAFHRLHPQLVKQFAGEYVAVFEEEMVDHDAAMATLLQRIEQRFPDEFVLIRPVRNEPEIVYQHRAVRWV